MEESHGQLQPQRPSPRRFVYRAANPDAQNYHPLRRSTDNHHLYRGMAGELCPQPLLIEWRVYMKLA